MIITRDEKRELLRTRDRVAAEVFEVLHLVLREVPALVSYRREILVDGSRGFLFCRSAVLLPARPRRQMGTISHAKKYRARKKLKLKKDQRRVEALTGRVEELEKQVCLLEDALSLI